MNSVRCVRVVPGILPVILSGALMLAPTDGRASDEFLPSAMEFYLFPEVCKAKMSDFPQNRDGRWSRKIPINEKKVAYWEKAIGPDWNHLHHYCLGLSRLSQAKDPDFLRRVKKTAKQHFGQAVGDFEYCYSRSRPGYPFWREIALKYAEALGGAGRSAEATAVINKIRKQDPSWAEAYILQARILKRRGKLNDAIALLKQGLSAGASRGPLLFHLAQYLYDVGDLTQARSVMEQAESAGMKMDRLRRKLGD